MAVKKFKPTTPSRRNMTMATFEEITTNVPEKSLLVSKKKTGGRNAQGKITVRHHGGGAKQKYRLIDFKRTKDGIPAKVATIEYDPNADIKVGNTLPIANIPVGTIVHNIELQVGKGAQLVRSAGSSAQLMAKESDYAQLRLPSGEVRYIRVNCRATIGTVSNLTHEIVNIGKAGRKRHMGIRPTVRGSVMNPNDHPHGGGEGRSPIGHASPRTPWGKPALGYKTRKTKKYSDKFIVKKRNSK